MPIIIICGIIIVRLIYVYAAWCSVNKDEAKKLAGRGRFSA